MNQNLERFIRYVKIDTQSDENTASIEALRKEYEEKHTEYAREILRRITEV